MILLKDILDFINTLNIANKENCYCGKMADKKQKAIGVYPMRSGREQTGTLGGAEKRSYEVKGVSLLVHWNKSPSETEKAAIRLQEALRGARNISINGHEIKFIEVSYDEPIPVDTDENGIFEYVIECLFYFGKEK